MMVVAVILVSFALPKSSEKKRLPDSAQSNPHAQIVPYQKSSYL